MNHILTRRERSILLANTKPEPLKVIAFELGITEGTLKQYMQTLYAKLNIAPRNRTALAVFAVEHKEQLS